MLGRARNPPRQHLALEGPKHNHSELDIDVRGALVHDALAAFQNIKERDAETRAGDNFVAVFCVDEVFERGGGGAREGGGGEGDEVGEGGLEVLA